jgi:hypothetical protein
MKFMSAFSNYAPYLYLNTFLPRLRFLGKQVGKHWEEKFEPPSKWPDPSNTMHKIDLDIADQIILD